MTEHPVPLGPNRKKLCECNGLRILGNILLIYQKSGVYLLIF
jgi:hypothetical protein